MLYGRRKGRRRCRGAEPTLELYVQPLTLEELVLNALCDIRFGVFVSVLAADAKKWTLRELIDGLRTHYYSKALKCTIIYCTPFG